MSNLNTQYLWKIKGDNMPRNKIKINMLVLLSFMLGIILVLQIKNVSYTNGLVTLKSIREIEEQIEVEKKEIVNLNNLISQKEDEYKRYEEELLSSGSIVPVLEEQKLAMAKISGNMSIKGRGIVVEIRDSDRELKEGENPNNVIVHDQDVLHIINDLKLAGAEAISVNGQRLLFMSEIKCSGPTITINGKTFGQPFVIAATGPIDEMKQAIINPDSYAYLLKSVYGIGIEYFTQESLTIPKYKKTVNFKYLKEVQ